MPSGESTLVAEGVDLLAESGGCGRMVKHLGGGAVKVLLVVGPLTVPDWLLRLRLPNGGAPVGDDSDRMGRGRRCPLCRSRSVRAESVVALVGRYPWIWRRPRISCIAYHCAVKSYDLRPHLVWQLCVLV